jgi:hypothetical protein
MLSMSLQELVNAATKAQDGHPNGYVTLPLFGWNEALIAAVMPTDKIQAQTLKDLRLGAFMAAGHAEVSVFTNQAAMVLSLVPAPGGTQQVSSTANPSTGIPADVAEALAAAVK